jgi:hypothetical protein
LEREGSGETSERQGCSQGRGEVLARPATVSERSKRRRKLSAALTPDGPAHHLESSQPLLREGHRAPRTPTGQLSWLASFPPPACRDRRLRSVGRWRWAGTRRGAGDSSGMSRASLCPGKRRIAPATEDLASNRWRRAEHSPASSAHLIGTAVRPQADGGTRARLIRWEEANSWRPRLLPATSFRAHRRHLARAAGPERPGRSASRSLIKRTGARSATVDIRSARNVATRPGVQSWRGRETRPRRADHAGLVSPAISSAVLWRWTL